MSFNYLAELSEDERMIEDTVRDAARARIAPLAARIDREDALLDEARGVLIELGLYGVTAPEAAGGAGMSFTSLAAAVAAIAEESASVAVHYALHVVRLVEVLAVSSNAAARAAAVQVIGGEIRAAFAGDERLTAVDDAQSTLKLEAHGTGFVLNGKAADVLEAAGAAALLVAPTLGPWVWVPSATEGVIVGTPKTRLGGRGLGVADVEFKNVKLSANAVVIGETETAAMKKSSDARLRLCWAAVAGGVTAAALRESLSYGLERKQFGQTIASFEAVREKIAGIAAALATTQCTWLLGARAASRDEDTGVIGRVAQLSAAEGAVRAADDALQIHGGYGFSQEYAVERLYRDAVMLAATGGGTDMLRLDLSAAALAR